MADYKHDHPGQKEPRAHGETHHENRIVDLNTASEEELADLPMVGPKRARDLMQHRPFKSWDEVQNVPGFDSGMIDDLKSGGAQIGSEGQWRAARHSHGGVNSPRQRPAPASGRPFGCT